MPPASEAIAMISAPAFCSGRTAAHSCATPTTAAPAKAAPSASASGQPS